MQHTPPAKAPACENKGSMEKAEDAVGVIMGFALYIVSK